MKKLTLVLVFCAAPALAQITVTPGESSTPSTSQSAQPGHPEAEKPPVRRAVPVKSSTPAPTATPAPKQKSGGFFGFFRRLFSSEETKKPSIKPTATPKAKPTIAPKATPAPKTSASPTPKATPAQPQPTATPKATPAQPKPTATPSVTVTPAATPTSTATPKPVKSPSRKNATPAPVTEGVTDLPIPATANHEDASYQKIKQQALKDPNVTALHEKMISTLNAHPEGGEAYKAAATEYTSALFEKMRKLDPANAEQINRKEGATKRRIDAGLPIVQ